MLCIDDLSEIGIFPCAKRREKLMNKVIKCPVPIGSVECGRGEIIKRKRGLGKRPDSMYLVVHHECELHEFHIQYPGGKWVPCDCAHYASPAVQEAPPA